MGTPNNSGVLLCRWTAHSVMSAALYHTHFNSIENFPPNITGPEVFEVTLQQTFTFDIQVEDTDLAFFSIVSGDVEGGNLEEDANNPSLYTFTWTPVNIPEIPIIFSASDELNASAQYIPIVQFCQCLNGECTLEGVLDPTANPVTLKLYM